MKHSNRLARIFLTFSLSTLATNLALGQMSVVADPTPTPEVITTPSIPTVEITDSETQQHQTGRHLPIRFTPPADSVIYMPDGKPYPPPLQKLLQHSKWWGSVDLRLVVGPDGTVKDAIATYGPEVHYENAIEEAKHWQYKPFQRHGKPIRAVVRSSIEVAPQEQRLEQHVRFPKIHDWKTLQISLHRSVCSLDYQCPEYSLEIHGDGTVLYEGLDSVGVQGKHRGHISQKALLELFDLFRQADYFSVKGEYAMFSRDKYTEICLSFDRTKKCVREDNGELSGMPSIVKDLEDAIDQFTESGKWVSGNNETIASLLREGINLKASNIANQNLLESLVKNSNADTLRDAIAAGLPVYYATSEALPLAAAKNNFDMVLTLLSAGTGSYNNQALDQA